MLDVLHWLPFRQRIQYRVVSLVWRCQLGLALAYLIDLCRPVSGAQGRRPLRSADREVLVVPFAHTAATQNRAYSVVGLGFGMISLRGCTCSLDYSPIHSRSFENLQVYLSALGLRALLSSHLEEALYKFLNERMNQDLQRDGYIAQLKVVRY